MTEIDTAIDGYDMYVNRLSSAAAAGGASNVGMNMANSGHNMVPPSWPPPPHQDHGGGGGGMNDPASRARQHSGQAGTNHGEMGSQDAFNNPTMGIGVGMGLGMGMPASGMWGAETGNAGQDWDWGLMLAGGH